MARGGTEFERPDGVAPGKWLSKRGIQVPKVSDLLNMSIGEVDPGTGDLVVGYELTPKGGGMLHSIYLKGSGHKGLGGEVIGPTGSPETVIEIFNGIPPFILRR